MKGGCNQAADRRLYVHFYMTSVPAGTLWKSTGRRWPSGWLVRCGKIRGL